MAFTKITTTSPDCLVISPADEHAVFTRKNFTITTPISRRKNASRRLQCPVHRGQLTHCMCYAVTMETKEQYTDYWRRKLYDSGAKINLRDAVVVCCKRIYE
jgi:hypothetical protein